MDDPAARMRVLRTLEGYPLSGDKHGEADRIHLLAEATKAAYHARDALKTGVFGFAKSSSQEIPRLGA